MINLYARLAGRSDVTLLSFDYSASQTHTIELGQNFRQIVARTTKAHLAADIALSASLGGIAVTDIAAIDIGDLSPRFNRVLSKTLYGADLVICEHPYCFNAIRKLWRGPLIYNAYNVEAQMKAALLPSNDEGSAALKKVIEIEAACCKAADLILVVADKDCTEIIARYAVDAEKIILVPNGANLPQKPVLDRAARLKKASRLGLNGKTSILVGGDHWPNVKGALATLDIARKTPDWQFLLIGSMCESDTLLSAVLPSNVFLMGQLTRPELLTAMAAADVGLNPIDEGGGTNLKVLDYAANGLVVVTTSFGNRGVSFKHGENCIVSEIENMASALDALSHAEPAYLEQIARKGFAHVAAHFTWDKIAERMPLPSTARSF